MEYKYNIYYYKFGSWDGIRTHEALRRELMKLLVLSTYLPNHKLVVPEGFEPSVVLTSRAALASVGYKPSVLTN